MARYKEDDRYQDDRHRGERSEQDATTEEGALIQGRKAQGRDDPGRNDRDSGGARSHASGSGGFSHSGRSNSTYPEQHGSHDSRRDPRDYGRGQDRSGGFDPYRARDYRQGGGYGGYDQAPGEGGGGLDSGRNYSAEPGWGPGYGAPGNERSRWQEGQANYSQGHHPEGPDPGARRSDSSRGPSYGGGDAADSYWGRPGRGGIDPAVRNWRGPKGYQRSDERLKEDICERLMWRGEHIDVSEVSIEVKEGKVMLEGAVPERRMKHAIEDIVDECMGVKDIENRIRVTYGEHRHVHAEGPSPERGSRASVGAGPGNSSAVSGMNEASSSGGRSE